MASCSSSWPTNLLVALIAWAPAMPTLAQGGSWGIASGRADATDAATLALDVGKLLNAERTLNLWRQDVTTLEEIQRQQQILGADEQIGAADWYEFKRAWLVQNVLQPALDIAANPAASCALSRSMVERIALQARQAQVIGVGDTSYGEFGDSSAVFARAFKIALRRCLEEAFDECRITGNPLAFFPLVGSDEIQRLKLFGEDEAWTTQVIYLITRCAVYKLNYRLTIDNQRGEVSSDWMGSFTLLFGSFGEGDLFRRMADGRWRAPRSGDDTPPDILLLRVDCPRGLTNCDRMPAETEDVSTGRVVARLAMRHRVIEQIPRVVEPADDQEARFFGGRVIIEQRTYDEGTDFLELAFLPPTVFLHARSRATGELLEREPAAGTDWYRRATQRAVRGDDNLPLVREWVRDGYPLLFRATSEEPPNPATTAFMSERTEFELVHRPDLFPADAIMPDLEVDQTQPDPPRLPARDGLGPFRN